ncbi:MULTISPECIES: transposase [Gluconobacter]|uniref:transposase n=1 Tax=Gluconobacter TaxID=441 RepID=UPI001B8CE947|nr:transposase [Gluconobacter sp. Dm-44]
MTAYARQHRSPCPFAGHWGKRGAYSKGFGRSRGGFTSKIHVRCDNQGRPLGFVLTGGQVSDYKAINALMKLPVPNLKAMLADRGHDKTALSFMSFLHIAVAKLWIRSFVNVT